MAPVKYRDVEIKAIEAISLEAVRGKSNMKVYAKLSISGIDRTVKRTPVDMQGGSEQKRNFRAKYKVDVNAFCPCGASLYIKIYCKRTWWKKDQYIGEVSARMMDLFAESKQQSEGGRVSREVTRDSQNSQGEITFIGKLYRNSEISQGKIRFSCAFSNEKTVKWWKKCFKWLARGLDITIQVVSQITLNTDLPINVERCAHSLVDIDYEYHASNF